MVPTARWLPSLDQDREQTQSLHAPQMDTLIKRHGKNIVLASIKEIQIWGSMWSAPVVHLCTGNSRNKK